ncbi:xanthine dehydrogenase family protein molybdopterin-binding subunit [Methylocystis echinoides]|uniref:xanthine dehydrogenase family protein molybdopterin-binding subunit n=1 Tax=Methylocystis echinoides TaxID=29468 RepID=UPI0034296574
MPFNRLASLAGGSAESSKRNVSRRTFLRAGAAVGGGLLVSVTLPRAMGEAEAADAGAFAPDAFIRIDRSGQVTLVIPQVEMGQGTYTSLPMLVAEELEVKLAQVRVEHAPPDDKLYGNSLIGFQATGGSTSVRAFWEPLRTAGAAARSMLITAAAAGWQASVASCRAEAGEVIHAPTGRRVAYGALVDRAATLPVPDKVALKEPKDFKLIGTAAKRLDAPAKVNGAAQYGIDVKVPGMKIAAVAASPVIGGKLARVDENKARAVRGVRGVVRLDDAVAVIADHMWAAKKGLAALDIHWDEGENAQLSTADVVKKLEDAANRPAVVAKQAGDVANAMAGAARMIEATYEAPFLAHATMEPMNCTAHVRKDGCDVWVGTQVVTRARAAAAAAAGLPLEKAQIHNQLLGGGFGRRLDVDYVTQSVLIARQVDFPVKVIWSREEDIQHDVYRPYYYDRLAAGLDDKGLPIAWSHRVVGSSVEARWSPEDFANGLDSDAVEGAAGPYAFPNVLIDYVREEPPFGLTTGWWRGVGMTHNAFMVEGFIDELAVATRSDPVAYRRALLDGNPRMRAALDLAAAKAGWGQPLPPGVGRGVSVMFGFETYIAQVAEVAVAKDGQLRVQRVVCAVDCGRTVNPDTIRAQIEGGVIFGLTAALYGEITLERGRVAQSNFDTYRMMRIDETPAIDVHIIESDAAPGGVGEPGTSAIAPAVVNAIFAATGKRLRRLPIRPADLRST